MTNKSQLYFIPGAGPSFIRRVSLQCDAVDAIFKRVDLGGGSIANPQARTRGTHSVLAFDDDTVQGIPWQKYLPAGYTPGSSFAVNIYWVSATAEVGAVVWAAAFERDNAGGLDIDGDDFAALQTGAASPAPGTTGVIQVATIPFTQAQADSIAAGEPFRLFVQRTADAAEDTMVGDAQLVCVVVEEVLS